MSENVIVRSLDNPSQDGPMDRAAFYKEQIQVFKDIGKPSKAVDVVNVFLFNANRELLIQKRSFDKKHNPGMLDKSIGGHIRYGDTPDYTVMVETVQELQTPSIVLSTEADFVKTHDLLRDYLETVAIIERKHIGIQIIPKVIDGGLVDIANNTHIYFGLYNGRIRPVDREAKGVIWYSLPELRKEMQTSPDTFSGDMRFYIDTFGDELEAFTKRF